MRKGKIVKNWPKCMIAMLVSVVAFVFVPDIVDAGLGKGNEELMASLLGMLVCTGAVIGLTALIRYREHNRRGEKYTASLARTLLMVPVYLVMSLLVSILSGIIAVMVHGALDDALSLDQIKGIIDLLAISLTLLVVPVLIVMFWEQISSAEPFGAAVKAGLRYSLGSYLKILIGMLVCAGAGWLALTAFHYLPENGVVTVMKILIFGIIGTVALVASEKACKKGVYQK